LLIFREGLSRFDPLKYLLVECIDRKVCIGLAVENQKWLFVFLGTAGGALLVCGGPANGVNPRSFAFSSCLGYAKINLIDLTL